MYRVFLGAPPASALASSEDEYRWKTLSSGSLAPTRTQSFVLPPATFEAASRRISLIYRSAIFDEGVEEEDQSFNRDKDGSTVISWPPTEPLAKKDSEKNDVSGPSFLLADESSVNHGVTTFLDSTRYETQFQETQSFDDSDASSIARFPTFHFNISALAPLPANVQVKLSRKVNILLAVLEVEGPDTIRIKKGVDAGKEVAILKMILGDEAGNVCKLTAWREVAEVWGGQREELAAKRGDIVHFENVMIACEPGLSATLTASPNLASKMTICYRTMPYSHQDGRLRPDLRLGDSDPCVRRVAAVVRWFEGRMGLPVATR